MIDANARNLCIDGMDDSTKTETDSKHRFSTSEIHTKTTRTLLYTDEAKGKEEGDVSDIQDIMACSMSYQRSILLLSDREHERTLVLSKVDKLL